MSETREHWSVGTDDTGDLTNWKNFVNFKDEMKNEIEEVHLVKEKNSLILLDSFQDSKLSHIKEKKKAG